jgi:putative DNA primase/helicase
MRAFQNFEDIEKLQNVVDKHRAWLKDYDEKVYSIAFEGKHKIKWMMENKKYSNENFSTEINCIRRLPNRTIIEFDCEEAKMFSDLVIKKLKEMKIGYIRTSHNGKSDYIWVEFSREMKDKEVKQFLAWIAPSGSTIDLNFASSRKVFPIMFAVHWKHSNFREMPIDYFEGEQIDYDSLKIELKERLKETLSKFRYETFNKEAGKVFSLKGQAEIFTQLQPLFYDKAGNWWLWNFKDYKWQMVDEVDILNMVENSTGMDIITPKERTLILNTLKQEGRKNIPEKIRPTWIQFRNIFYDIETGNEIEVSHKFFATNPIPYEINKDKFMETPVMDKIFEEWVGKGYIRTLYEIIAYCLLPDYPIHRLFCLIGAGLNGKSCFLRLLKKFIGEENVTATELDVLLSSRFEVTRVYKKLVCIMGETNFNEINKTSIIKKLTGQDLIGFEYKNKTPFDDMNYAKILIATNNLPTTTDKTIGFYRRWLIIDFPNRFSEEKDILKSIPEEEYTFLSLKCVFILKDLLSKRAFSNEGSVEDRMERYEARSNFLEKFFKESIEEDVNGYITKADFYKRFIAWCKENKYREMSETSVGLALKKFDIQDSRKYFDWLFEGKGGTARVWIGIKWREDSMTGWTG